MAALQYVDVPNYAALLLRRTFPELEGSEGLIGQAHEWLDETDAVWNEQKHRWTFPSGAMIQFGHVQEERDKTNYQGQAYQLVGFDELTHFTESIYEYVAFTRSRRRTTMRDLGVPIRTRSASNPGGIGHAWVKRRFISERKPGVVFVPAKLRDNPGLDATDYEHSFENVNDELRRQLLDGDWDAHEGAAYQLTPAHLIRRPDGLESWAERFESMDYGLSNPTAWLAHAVDYEGNLVTFAEFYKPGLPSEVAPIIRRLRMLWGTDFCWGDPQSLAAPGLSGLRPGQRSTIQSDFVDLGLPIAKAKNDPRVGYLRMRELLKCDDERRFPSWHPQAGEYGSPRWFIVEQACPELVDQLTAAIVAPVEHRWHGEMVDAKWEGDHGHAHAAARYGVASRFDASPIPPAIPDPEPPPNEIRDSYWQQRLERLDGAEGDDLMEV